MENAAVSFSCRAGTVISNVAQRPLFTGNGKHIYHLLAEPAAIDIAIIVETLVIDVMENGQSSEPKERLAKTLESYEECPQYKDQRSEKH
tara:strand:- start:657 stop:926 length:270 start_codon:yes stop_codon:yes gene_type:complete